ncbi:hypothetical protein PSTG_01113 [Puccinia striiformis f. sp. tritici PST-78]|uniref:Uncharacterized protein n=1 Tax=Puccinia striiformis f. sp. tritici PST-78 TaxID=1165861 RepID=A0A0L0W347_9BASI|nr:hypothetical protein PSTG_01113 [Puccinia striiformis f. sp. tritici PST-78]
MATRRHRETRAQLDFLLSKQNPFKPPGRNYQVSYFEKKWNHQRTFRADHTDEEQERRNKLIKIYEHQATIDKLRSRQLQKDAEGISDLPPDEENQIVHTSGASHSRTLDANKTGPRVGTDRKEEISEAMWKRKLAFKKLLNKYNKLYSEFSKTFPTHPAANSPLHPVDYDDFLKWPLDHESWNDGLYFQTTAPWSVEPDVCSGISCVLMLSRIQEEFQLIAQELARSVGWALDYYNNCKDKIQVLN